jgi:hypothetical protein
MDVMSRPDRAVFRLPVAALFVPVLILFCITPLATVAPWWGVLFAVPLGAVAWVIVTRTTANSERVTAHGLLGAKRMDWTDMDGLEFRDSRWAIAVGHDGRRLRLPMVRPRDLPRLTAVSGGSLVLGEESTTALTDEQGRDSEVPVDDPVDDPADVPEETVPTLDPTAHPAEPGQPAAGYGAAGRPDPRRPAAGDLRVSAQAPSVTAPGPTR